MEKGKVRTVAGYGGGGSIADQEGRLINYSNGNIVAKDRNQVKPGDLVWFERLGARSELKAINIRRC